MPEITYHYPNDATGSSSSGEEATWPTAGYQPRRRGYRPQIPETQQAADEFTTSSSENSLEEYQISGTPRLRRTRSSVRAEDPQQDDESIAVDSHLPNEVNLSVVTDTASMLYEEDVIWIRRHEQSGSDADSERSNSPEMLAIAGSNEAIDVQESWISKLSIFTDELPIFLLLEYAKLAGIEQCDDRRLHTKDQNSLGKSFVLQNEAIC